MSQGLLKVYRLLQGAKSLSSIFQNLNHSAPKRDRGAAILLDKILNHDTNRAQLNKTMLGVKS